ncbi:MAG: hypothetical protein A3J07_01825 [Candidatus Doudnabacteria bacterium RIFCSPLOWO2_02_FULL_49_13]|uniref:Uncharacterized protein n=1 Tax=Candidatus Doudnabacteria bacterium RIFCSPHIGHO2_12_FULL_48_16 TaxID=1817838 RepID=A0A1F5PL92_9BACT|nr:MAG: hypothetical protein A3B77_00890 [Candidatus Doudnabacteria bacterium RIFCSPHIGHO2_02_FULL_49_24]OGE88802.1 MAG: hypothetical protein A2760_01245 [Candidatus Doudnabacteria bacterium RIFCSPHIGHO2_01_FULL_50_67]OGE90676.1 MAG: hypothetical protein A3E29_00920 [Candidatus Doudnabacteria bacterium RIFCSPHIGHO2_12_FULL_48_16]OGE97007.1 MAG: hypothetical protein A2990_02945 [Candidatus Doudnabacteria bacterium RIFCSPLOWO2_01_FULL_49_40]OGF02541.1 MAG: hypothetical protein A3J07_01825 [Candid
MVIFAAIVFIVSLLTIMGLFLFRFSQVLQRPLVKVRLTSAVEQPTRLRTYFRSKLKVMGQSLWHFVLEAKDLKPATAKTIQTQYQKVKSVFRIRIRSSEQEPLWLPEAQELTVKTGERLNPEETYLEAIKKNPTDKQAYESLGRHYLQVKNFTEAAQTYEYLIKLDPARDIYFSNLGLSYYSLGEFPKAVQCYEKALAINSKIPTRWINLALCFLALDETVRAIKALSQAITLDKLNTNYLTLLADAYIKIGNQVRAEEVLEQILAVEPTNKFAREKLMKLKI